MTLLSVATVLAFVACAYGATLAGAALCRDVEPFADGPRSRQPPVLAFVVAAAAVGVAIAVRHPTIPQIAIGALLVGTLVACTYSDMVCGIVPDRFTLIPLGALVVYSIFAGDVRPLVAALVVAFPFAGAALLSKGLGMGWGDVKLAGLVGAVVGIAPAIVAFACACALAGTIAIVRGRTREPVALVPYLASFAAVAFAWSP